MQEFLNELPFSKAGPEDIKGSCCIIRRNNLEAPYYCGYCAIQKDQIPESWHGDYNADGLQYLRIHGGITYTEVRGDYVVFGFDCAHLHDDENPLLQDPEHVMKLAQDMESLLLVYAGKLKENPPINEEDRLAIIDEVNKTSQFENDFGFGAMIELLCGGTNS